MGCCGLVSCILGLCLILKFIDWLLRRPKLGLSSKTKNILVTGCDTGFGHLFAKRMDKKGFCVFAGCLTEEGIKTLTEACSSQMIAFQLDVTSEDSVERAVDLVKMKLERSDSKSLWAVVNNAGIAGAIAPVSWMNREDFNSSMNINFHGMHSVCQAFLPMLKESQGRIVNTASILGRLSIPGCVPYCVSKYAVEAYSDALRRDICHFGVSVHIIEPGYFNTGIVNVERYLLYLNHKYNEQPPQVRLQYGESYPQEGAKHMRAKLKVMSTKLELVPDAYEHAVLSVYPRIRYTVGWDAKFLFIPLSLMPGWVGDIFFQRVGLKPKQSVM